VTDSARLDLVRSIYPVWERGDFSSTEWAHPGIEFVIADGPSPGRWTGLAGMAEGFRDLANAWEQYRVRADEYQELDDERVLVFVKQRGRGKTSGLELGRLQSTGAAVYHVRDGKVSRLVLYMDRDHALADLGLAPETDSPGS
jgi:ketosteroid isomerase-like protein